MDLDRLEAAAERFLLNGLAESTNRVYATGKRAYLTFCNRFGLTPVPASQQTLILFVAELAQSVSPSTVRTYLSGVRHLHIVQGHTSPLSDTPKLDLVLAGIKRLHRTPKPIRLPITPLILQKILEGIELLEEPPYTKAMLHAACRVGFFGFMRSGEITVVSATAYDPDKHLSVRDVSVNDHSNPQLICVFLRHSKTDQFHRGSSVYLARIDSPLCPVTSLLQFLVIRGQTPGPLFSLPNGTPLTKQKFISLVRAALRHSGIDPSPYKGHSFRIGAATTAAAYGIHESIIKQMGRWASSAYQTYVQVPTSNLIQITNRLAGTSPPTTRN